MFYKILFILSLFFFFGCNSKQSEDIVQEKKVVKAEPESLQKKSNDPPVKISPPLEHEADYKIILKQQAEEMNAFLLKRDFKSFAKYTHPALIKLLGGEKKMVAAMQKGFKEMEAGGNKLSTLRVDIPGKIILIGDELQTTLTESLEMKVPRGKLITKSVLIVISKDGGKHWYFLDTSGKDLKQIRSELPNISEELVIPAPEQAQLIEVK